MRQFLDAHDIVFKPRPKRHHSKTEIVDRKIKTIKAILRRIDQEPSRANDHEILTRGVFLSKLFSGSSKLSPLQLLSRYQPSILGIHPSVVPQELLDAHIAQSAVGKLRTTRYANI